MVDYTLPTANACITATSFRKQTEKNNCSVGFYEFRHTGNDIFCTVMKKDKNLACKFADDAV